MTKRLNDGSNEIEAHAKKVKTIYYKPNNLWSSR